MRERQEVLVEFMMTGSGEIWISTADVLLPACLLSFEDVSSINYQRIINKNVLTFNNMLLPRFRKLGGK